MPEEIVEGSQEVVEEATLTQADGIEDVSSLSDEEIDAQFDLMANSENVEEAENSNDEQETEEGAPGEAENLQEGEENSEVDDMRQQNADMQETLRQTFQRVDRQATENGQLKKELEALKAQNTDEVVDDGDDMEITGEDIIDSPVKNISKIVEASAKKFKMTPEEAKAMFKELISEELKATEDAQNQENQVIADKKAIVMNSVPNIEDIIDDIADLAKAQGGSDEQIKAFKANPWAQESSGLIAYGMKVNHQREIEAIKGGKVNHAKRLVVSKKNQSKTKSIPSSDGSLEKALDPGSVINMTDEQIDQQLASVGVR